MRNLRLGVVCLCAFLLGTVSLQASPILDIRTEVLIGARDINFPGTIFSAENGLRKWGVFNHQPDRLDANEIAYIPGAAGRFGAAHGYRSVMHSKRQPIATPEPTSLVILEVGLGLFALVLLRRVVGSRNIRQRV
jgi:hypothetical protein